MKRILFGLIAVLLWASSVDAQYVRDLCSTLTIAATEKATCFDYTAFALKYWNGSSWASAGAAAGYSTVADEASGLTQRSILNFTGAGVTCVDNGGATRTDCTISGGGSGGLTLVEKKLVAANSTTLTFSSLDGNTDENYRLTCRLQNKSGGAVIYSWLPNNLTTNLSSGMTADDGGGNNADTTVLLLSRNDTAKPVNNSYVDFNMDIYAKKNPNAQSFILTYNGETRNLEPGVGVSNRGHLGGLWNETSTNLTSIVVQSSVADGIGNGSTCALYKYAQ